MTARLPHCLGIALAAVLALAAPAAAASLDIAATDSDRDLWKAVMTGLYGPYDGGGKCWVGSAGADRSCMRPMRLDRVEEGGTRRLYIATGGGALSGNDCHGCAGYVGLVVLEEEGGRFRLAADNGLHEQMGAWGAAPPEESFALHRIGPDNHGWTIESGFTGQGVTMGGQTVHVMRGGKVAEIGRITTIFDNCGFDPDDCRSREASVTFDPASAADPYYAATVVIDKAEPPVAETRFKVPFDKVSGRYTTPAALEKAFE